MFSCLNKSARVIVPHRPMKTEMEDDFSSKAFFICLTVKMHEDHTYLFKSLVSPRDLQMNTTRLRCRGMFLSD
jgi:hypothetical protein